MSLNSDYRRLSHCDQISRFWLFWLKIIQGKNDITLFLYPHPSLGNEKTQKIGA